MSLVELSKDYQLEVLRKELESRTNELIAKIDQLVSLDPRDRQTNPHIIRTVWNGLNMTYDKIVLLSAEPEVSRPKPKKVDMEVY